MVRIKERGLWNLRKSDLDKRTEKLCDKVWRNTDHHRTGDRPLAEDLLRISE